MIALLRRLPLRGVARHPGRAVLTIGAALLGTAMCTATFVVRDSVSMSIRDTIDARLGPINDVVNTQDVPSALQGYTTLTDASMPAVDRILAVQLAEAFVGVDSGRTEPRATVIAADPARAAQFGFPEAQLGPNEAAITSDLASALHVNAGAFVQLGADARRMPLRVVRVVASRGLAGYSPALHATARNIVVSQDTLAALDLRPYVALFVSSAPGQSAAAHEQVADALAGTDLFATPVRQRLLEEASRESRIMRNVMLGGAITGLALQLVLLVALLLFFAEAHTTEHETLHALGLRPRVAATMFVTAAACYAVPAAVAGGVAGVGAGTVVAQYMRGWFASGWSSESFFLHVHVSRGAVMAGVIAGLAVFALATIIAALILRTRTQTKTRPALTDLSVRGLVVARAGLGAGAVLTALGVAAGSVILLVAGPVVCCCCLAPELPFRRAPRIAVTIAFGTAIACALIAIHVARARGVALSNTSLTFTGIVVVLLGVTLTVAWQPELGRVLASIRRRDPAAARVAYACPPAQFARRAALLATVAVVTFTVLFAPIGGGEGAPGTDASARASAGGFDVLATAGSAVPIPFDRVRSVPSVLTVAPLASSIVRIRAVGTNDQASRAITTFDASLLLRRPPQLLDRGPFPSDRAAFQAVLDRSDLVITSSTLFAPFAGRPVRRVAAGDRLYVEDPVHGRQREVVVAGTTSSDFLSLGLLTSAHTGEAALGHALPVNEFFAGAGADRAEEAARVIRGQLFTFGVDAHTVDELVGRVNHHYATYLLALHAFQALALVVALGIIVVLVMRAARHRRRELISFRAIGATRGDVERVVITEIVFVVAQALVLGAGAATLMSYVGHATLRPGLPWVFPTVATVGVVAGALGLTIAVAILLARNVALRVAE